MKIRLMAAALLLSASAAWSADWKPVERVEHYAIGGATGLELYRSIGEQGPKLGTGRAIAYTNFKLTWRRDYRPSDGGCVLRSAVPKLIITTRLPKPSGRLPAATQRHWDIFIAGIAAHERVHGEMIVDMVRELETASIGLTVANDSNCRKIRQALVAPFRKISNERVEKSRAFDREEMSDGGNVHRLILRLVNGE